MYVLEVSNRALQPGVIFYEEISVGAAAVGLTAAQVQASTLVRVSFADGAMRFRSDGTDPTAAVGIPALNGQERVFLRSEALTAKFIRVTGLNGLLRVTYFGIVTYPA